MSDIWRDALDWLEDTRDDLRDRRRDFQRYLQRRRRRLETREEANVLRQLSLMFESGIPLHDALEVLAKTMEGRSSELAEEILDALHRGHSLSHAFFQSQDRLSDVTPPLVEAGESSGGLARTLEIAAQWAELSASLKARLTSAMVYPAFVLVVNMLLAGAMLGYVFPTFIPLFEGHDLPWLTRFFLGFSWFASSKLFWIVVLLALLEMAFLLSQPDNREKLYRFGLMLPVVSPLLRCAARTRFCSVLAVTSRTGLPLLKALALAAKASGDPEFRDLDRELQREIRDGASLDEHFLLHSEVYGLTLAHGMALCQSTGNTDLVCGHLATLFEGETEVRIQQMQALLEPMLIGLVSFTTGVLLLSLYWPLGRFLQTLLGA